MRDDMDNKNIRRINLQILRTECDPPTWAEVERRSSVRQNYLSQIVSKGRHARNMGDSAARRLEQGFGKPKGWMDQLHLDDSLDHIPIEKQMEIAVRNLPGIDEEEAEFVLRILRGLRPAE